MKVTVNGAEKVVEDGSVIGVVVDDLGRGRRGMAIARNGEVVPRSQWDLTPVVAGDRIEIVVAAQGG
jgi:sulfur carrier protein